MASENFEKWTTPEGLALVTGWCREGYTNKMIAERMGVHPNTLLQWTKKSNELRDAIKQGKEVADYMVENALFKAAIGFEHTETKTYITGQPDKQGNRNVKVEKTVKYFPPNVTAMAMWLNNRKPDQWRRNRDNIFELNDEESNITVNIVKSSEARKKEAEEKERREAEGIKTEEVSQDEFSEYQNGFFEAEDETEVEEFEEQGERLGITSESEAEDDGDWDA